MSRVSLIIGGVTADLYKGEDITLVKQAKDLTDLGATRTDFSRPFTIPATDTNNGIFEHFYNLDIDDPYPVHNKAEASINVKGVQIFEGVLELMNVTLKNNIPDSYEVNFYGRNKQLTTLWGDDTLQDIDFNLDHALTSTNVKASWSGTLQSGKVRYPVIDFGARPSGAFTYNTQVLFNASNIGQSDGAISPVELRPAVRLNEVVENCFTHIGKTLTIDSNIDDDDLYMMGMETEGTIQRDHDGRFEAIKESISFSVVLNDTNDLTSYDTEVSDPSNLFDHTTTGQYDPRGSGTYTFEFSFTNWSLVPFEIRLVDSSGNILPGAIIPVTIGQAAQTHQIQTLISYGSANVLVQLRALQAGTLSFNDFTFSCVDAVKLLDDPTILIEETMPDMRIQKFISGVLEMFNAVITTTDGVAYTMTNLTDYLNAGSTRDWTNKIATSVFKVDKIEVPDAVELKHAETDDLANNEYRSAFARDYGAVDYENGGIFDFTSGEISVETPFTIFPTTLLNMVSGAGANAGATDLEIYSFTDSDGKSMKVPLSLFYFAGYQSVNNAWYFNEGTGLTSNAVRQTSFPFFRSFDARPAVTATDTLTFSSISDENNVTPSNTFFARYWRPHLDRIFNPKMRRVQVTAYLETTDWLDFEMNDTIQIATRPYKIEKISYNMTQGRATLDLFTYDVKATAVPTIGDDGGVTWDITPTNQDLKIYGVNRSGSSYFKQLDPIRRGRSQQQRNTQALDHLTFLATPRVLDMIINTDESISMTTSYQEIGGYDTSTFDQCTCFTKNLTTGEFTQNDNFITEVFFHASFTNETTKDIQFAILVNGVETNFVAFEPNGSSEVMLVGLINLLQDDTISIGIKKVASGNATLTIADASFIVKRA